LASFDDCHYFYMASPSGNPRKRRSSLSHIPPIVEDKRPRVSDIDAQGKQVSLPEAVLKKAKENLMDIKNQVEDTINMLTFPDGVTEPSGGRQEGPKKRKRSLSPKGPAKAVKTPMAANQTIPMNHSEIVRSQPGWIFNEKETRIQGIILCLAILQKVECDPIEFLENMKVVTQLVGLGSHKFQPTRILYLNLDKIDKYVFPLFHEVDVH